MIPAETLANERAKTQREALERSMLLAIRAHKLPAPEQQVRFHATRRWRFDLAWHAPRGRDYAGLAVEVDGGIYSGGRHTRGKGHEQDAEKRNEAQLCGWVVIVVTSAHIRSGAAVEWVRRGLAAVGLMP